MSIVGGLIWFPCVRRRSLVSRRPGHSQRKPQLPPQIRGRRGALNTDFEIWDYFFFFLSGLSIGA